MTPNSTDDIAKAKTALRKVAVNHRGGLSVEERAEKSTQASNHFLAQGNFKNSSKIALYWPMGNELNCRVLIETLEIVALPCIAGLNKPLVFREYEGADKLVSAAFGTHEPTHNAPEITPDIIVLPLLAFDKTGARLGYGGGFYDRTIAAMKSLPKLVGLAFDVQEQDFVPTSSHDKALDMIVTETGIIEFSKES